MIVLDLICGSGHRFEGWFASAEAYAAQLERAQVDCPHCGSSAISKLPSGPYVQVRRSSDPQVTETAEAAVTAALGAALQSAMALAEDAEDVGQRFPEEARRIHHEESPLRSIRGQASVADALELIEEGIPVLPLPIPPKKSQH